MVMGGCTLLPVPLEPTSNSTILRVTILSCTQIEEQSDNHCGMSTMADNNHSVTNVSIFKQVTDQCVMLYINWSTVSSEVFRVIVMHRFDRYLKWPILADIICLRFTNLGH